MDRIKESFDSLPIAACFFGPIGVAAAGAICLLAGIWERRGTDLVCSVNFPQAIEGVR